MASKKQEYALKWKNAFKPLGKPGAATGNAIAVEYEGVVYDTLAEASRVTGKSTAWIKKHGKLLK